MRSEARATVGATPLTSQLYCEAATDWSGLVGALAPRG